MIYVDVSYHGVGTRTYTVPQRKMISWDLFPILWLTKHASKMRFSAGLRRVPLLSYFPFNFNQFGIELVRPPTQSRNGWISLKRVEETEHIKS